jgi:stage III sporulation protein AE
MKRKIILLIIIVAIFSVFSTTTIIANANDLTQNINDQLNNLDISELEKFYNDLLINNSTNINIKDKLVSLLKGEYDNDFNSILELIFSNVINEVKNYLPIALIIITIFIFTSIIKNIKSNYLGESTINIINLVCSITIILMLYKEIFFIYQLTRKTIENITNLNQIMSPIIITLMVATGSKVSASVYSPQTILLSGIITNVFLNVILPLNIVMTVINATSSLSGNNNLNSFNEFITSLIKWIIGISFTVFAIFITTQGLTSATFDGASIKAAKYAISNSIPIVGGFLKDGFDVMIAGSILIKNSLGIIGIILVFTIIFAPIVKILVLSLILKLTNALIETFYNGKMTSLIKNSSKCISYFNISILISGFMLFITILITIITANSFI